MRKLIVATFALTPIFLHAQASSPVQPQTSGTPTTLQSKLIQPKELHASESDHGIAPIRISTGVVAPKLIHILQIEKDYEVNPSLFLVDRKVVVGMTVDATGKPSNLKILQSLGPGMDNNVLRAISQYRFTPGTLDGQPTAIPLTLEVVVHEPAR